MAIRNLPVKNREKEATRVLCNRENVSDYREPSDRTFEYALVDMSNVTHAEKDGFGRPKLINHVKVVESLVEAGFSEERIIAVAPSLVAEGLEHSRHPDVDSHIYIVDGPVGRQFQLVELARG